MKKFFTLLCLIFLASLSLAQTDIEDDLKDLLAEYLEDDETGLVLYINYDGAEWLVADGLADIEREIPMREDDLFRLASVTKPFVATLVLQLVAEGEFELDEPIAGYLPNDISKNLENADEATIRQVLQMSSGIYDYLETDAYNEILEDDPLHPWTPEEVLSMAYGEDAYFEAGTDYSYSNSNYILAQILIERVTGNSLAEELEDRIFQPLAMESCYLETYDVFAENIVRGYEVWDDDYVDVTEINDSTGLGDGGIICNAEDLGLFLPALMNGEILDDAMLDEMLDTIDDGEGGEYGLGIVSMDDSYGWEIWHDGASAGFQSFMYYLPDENLSLVILSNNFDSEIVVDLFYDVMDLALDE